LDAGEQIPSLSKGFMDIGLGVNNTLYISDSELKLAYSLAHLNKPDRSFYSNKDLLPVKHQLSTVFTKAPYHSMVGRTVLSITPCKANKHNAFWALTFRLILANIITKK